MIRCSLWFLSGSPTLFSCDLSLHLSVLRYFSGPIPLIYPFIVSLIHKPYKFKKEEDKLNFLLIRFVINILSQLPKYYIFLYWSTIRVFPFTPLSRFILVKKYDNFNFSVIRKSEGEFYCDKNWSNNI